MSEDDSEPLVIFPLPALVVLLIAKEREKGSALTRAEVEKIRSGAVAMVLPESRAGKLEEERGYVDIDPENCWEEWQLFRAQEEELAED